MKIAISTDFFTALSKLPKKQMHKTIKLVEDFRKNPTSSGFNYEKIQNADQMYSIRVDLAYRCIVMKPKKGDVYILLWVDHHDDAYDWAKRHKCLVNPETGSLQILETEYLAAPETTVETKEGTFFSKYRDKDLLRLGIPAQLLSKVRAIRNEEELDTLQEVLPQEAYEGLFYLMAGDSLEEVYRYLSTIPAEPVDTSDFAKALEQNISKQHFYVVDESDVDLISMLHAPLEKWRVFLHPSQRRLVERDWNGPVRVLGGAGTGKTVVAMHRAKWLAEKALMHNGKILFTTFTKNLAMDIYENLKKICKDDLLEYIEVKNLDQWVYEFLYKNGYQEQIVYSDQTDQLWDDALMLKPSSLDLPDSFFKEEWERVIQPQSVTTLQEYIRAKRIGRSTRLSRAQRKMAWDVFEEYRLLLSRRNFKEPSDAMRDAKILIEQGKLEEKYESVVVDEAQDFSEQAFMLLRALVPEGKNDLFIVGDAYQRIYGHKVVLGQCGIKIVGRSRKLKLNYRTTDEIRKWAVTLFDAYQVDDLDNGIDKQNDYKSLYHGPEPVIQVFDTVEEESKAIKSHIDSILYEDETSQICVVVRTQRLVKKYKDILEKMQFETLVLSRNTKDNLAQKAIRIATMHRVKGLEFDHIIIANVSKGVVPPAVISKSAEEQIEDEQDLKERSLLFVAATRAKKSLMITAVGSPSEFIKP